MNPEEKLIDVFGAIRKCHELLCDKFHIDRNAELYSLVESGDFFKMPVAFQMEMLKDQENLYVGKGEEFRYLVDRKKMLPADFPFEFMRAINAYRATLNANPP